MQKFAILLITILAGCNPTEGSQSEKFIPSRSIGDIISDTMIDTVNGAWSVAQTPFEDLGLKEQPIPEKLQQIADNPYKLPLSLNCESLRNEIIELDALLGPDICTLENQAGVAKSSKGEYIEQGARLARDQAVGMVSSKVNIIPFRSIVRRISGAEKHAKLIERSYQAGKLRRAFLKGIVESWGNKCLYYSTPKLGTARVGF